MAPTPRHLKVHLTLRLRALLSLLVVRKKKKSPEVIRAEAKMQRQRFWGRIGDRYTEVSSVEVVLTRTDPNPHLQPGGPSTDTRTLSPGSSALIEVGCGNRECTKGVHDLSEVVRDMAAEREEARTGQMVCNGWQDEERVGSHRCLMQLDYTVTIAYAKE